MSNESTPLPPQNPQAKPVLNHTILLTAWRRLIKYDEISETEKSNFKQIRYTVVSVTFLVTLVSVVTLMLDFIHPLLIGSSVTIFVATVALLFNQPNKTQKKTTTDNKLNDDKRFLLFVRRKHFYIYRRLFLSFLIGVTSVVALTFFENALKNGLGLIGLILPIIALNLLNYSTMFAGPTTWIEYRYAAEQIRSAIYLYRAKGGIYYGIANKDLDDKFVEELNKIKVAYVVGAKRKKQVSESPINVIKVSLEEAKEEVKKILENSGDDDGFKPLDDEDGLTQYIETRINKQWSWYQEKIDKDYMDGKRYTQYAIFITTIGSILGLIFGAIQPQWIGIFAITNALTLALYSISNINMAGKTYGIYHKTQGDLEDELNKWLSIGDNELSQEELKKKQAEFIGAIEKILMTELDIWYNTASEIQITNDRDMRTNIKQDNDDNSQTFTSVKTKK